MYFTSMKGTFHMHDSMFSHKKKTKLILPGLRDYHTSVYTTISQYPYFILNKLFHVIATQITTYTPDYTLTVRI